MFQVQDKVEFEGKVYWVEASDGITVTLCDAGMEMKHVPVRRFEDTAKLNPPSFWVVLADGSQRDSLSEQEYMRLSEGGETIDGGQE